MPKFQSFWEFLMILLVLVVWGSRFTSTSLGILGDNVAAINGALSYKGRGPMPAVAREIAWRRAVFRWAFRVGHIPSESNVLADKLSRLVAPSPASFPPVLQSARCVVAPTIKDVWHCRW